LAAWTWLMADSWFDAWILFFSTQSNSPISNTNRAHFEFDTCRNRHSSARLRMPRRARRNAGGAPGARDAL